MISSIIRSISQPAPPVKPMKRSYPDPRGIPERGLQRPGGRPGSYGAYPGRKLFTSLNKPPLNMRQYHSSMMKWRLHPACFPEPEAATDTGITTMLETENTRKHRNTNLIFPRQPDKRHYPVGSAGAALIAPQAINHNMTIWHSKECFLLLLYRKEYAYLLEMGVEL